MTALKVLALLTIAVVLIACVGFVSIAASTVGGPKGNAYFFGGLAGILCIVAATGFLLYRTVAS